MKQLLVLFTIVILICFFLSIYNYLLDCFFDFDYFITKPDTWGGYFAYYLIFSWAAVPLIIMYWGLAENFQVFDSLAIKSLYVLFCAAILGLWAFYPGNFSFYHGQYRDIKAFLAYLLSGLTVMFIYEFYIRKRKA